MRGTGSPAGPSHTGNIDGRVVECYHYQRSRCKGNRCGEQRRARGVIFNCDGAGATAVTTPHSQSVTVDSKLEARTVNNAQAPYAEDAIGGGPRGQQR